MSVYSVWQERDRDELKGRAPSWAVDHEELLGGLVGVVGHVLALY